MIQTRNYFFLDVNFIYFFNILSSVGKEVFGFNQDVYRSSFLKVWKKLIAIVYNWHHDVDVDPQLFLNL